MVNENTLFLKQLEHERNARRHADKLLEQKSLEFENTNHHLQSLVDAKTEKLHQLNEYKKAVEELEKIVKIPEPFVAILGFLILLVLVRRC